MCMLNIPRVSQNTSEVNSLSRNLNVVNVLNGCLSPEKSISQMSISQIHGMVKRPPIFPPPLTAMHMTQVQSPPLILSVVNVRV